MPVDLSYQGESWWSQRVNREVPCRQLYLEPTAIEAGGNRLLTDFTKSNATQFDLLKRYLYLLICTDTY